MEEQHHNCVMCRCGLHNARYQQHILTDDLPIARPAFAAYIQEHAVLQVAFNNTQRVCHRCWQRIENGVRQNDDVVPAAPEIELDAQELEVPDYMRAPNTSRHCIFDYCRNTTRHRIPESMKLHMFTEHKLYIPDGARVCRQHLEGNIWDELPEHCNVTHRFNAEQFTDVCNMTRKYLQRGGPRLDFNTIGALTNAEMHFWTGHNIQQFDAILEQVPSIFHNQDCSNPKNALGMYLIKLRTGDADSRLASLFQVSERTVGRWLRVARECLKNEYVILHLGWDHLRRNEVLERNLTIPKALFGNEENNKAILIFDGTYIYINKSSNFLFQRQSYSLHKYRNLLKPFLIVCSDGYIIDVLGPYAATKTDANIMSDIMNDEENPLHALLQADDVFILDRGFRDSLGDIDACGYESYMPPTKYRNETQLTAEQANDARAVTICRWVVEVVNGKFKRDFKLFRQSYFNRTLPHMMTNFRIAAALINHFHEPIADSNHAETFLNIIRNKMDTPNLLHSYVQRKNLNNRRADFQRIEANGVQIFPRLSEEHVIFLSLGTYQLKLARSYCNEHMRDGLYLIKVYREIALEDLPDYGIDDDVWLLRGRIQSRHIRSRTYYCYLLIKDDTTDNVNDIIQHYCSCLTGRRTMGTCAHIISIVWYLGYARHEGFTAPAPFLNDMIVDEHI